MRIFVCAGVCLLGSVLGAPSAWAQTDRVVSGGIKAGVTSATLSVTGLQEFEPDRRIGVVGGGFLTIGRRIVRVQPEVLIATKKFSAASPIGAIDVASRSVDVPVLLVTRMRPEARVHPLLFAGPFLSVISKATQTIDGVETDIKGQLKGTDLGVVVGAGLDVGTKRGSVLIDARYAIGLKDISKSSATTFKSRTLMFSIGYRF